MFFSSSCKDHKHQNKSWIRRSPFSHCANISVPFSCFLCSAVWVVVSFLFLSGIFSPSMASREQLRECYRPSKALDDRERSVHANPSPAHLIVLELIIKHQPMWQTNSPEIREICDLVIVALKCCFTLWGIQTIQFREWIWMKIKTWWRMRCAHPYPDVFLSLKAKFTQCHFIHQDCFGVSCPVLEIPRDNKMEPLAICLA